MRNILFVCLGNICRSPAAEGIFRAKVQDAKLQEQFFIDSAGTCDHHIGELPDPRMREHALGRGLNLDNLRGRQFVTADFDKFEYIVVMDSSNYTNVVSLARHADDEKKVYRMTDFCKQHDISDVPDPYFGGAEGFEHVLNILEDASTNLLLSINSK